MSVVALINHLRNQAGNLVSNEVYGGKRVLAQANPFDGGLTFNHPQYQSPSVNIRQPNPGTMNGGVPVINPNTPRQFIQNGVAYRNPDHSPIATDGSAPLLIHPNNGNLSATDYYRAVPLVQPNFQRFNRLPLL